MIIRMDFDIIDQVLIRYFSFVRYYRNNGSTVRQYMHCL